MEDQFVHRFTGTAAEFHAEALEPGCGEGSRLVGEQLGGWLSPNCQCELSIIVQPHDDSHQPLAETADAVLAEGWIHAIAGRDADEDDFLDERLEGSRQLRDVSFAVGGK